MDSRRPRLDHGLHQLERVQGAAEARLGVGDDRCEPVGLCPPLRPLDLVGPQERIVDLADHGGRAGGRVEAEVGIHLAGLVVVRGHLPPAHVDRRDAGLHDLDGLVAGEGAERPDILPGLHQVPEPRGSHCGQRLLDPNRPPQPYHVAGSVGPPDPAPAGVVRPLALERLHVVPDASCKVDVRHEGPPRCSACAPRGGRSEWPGSFAPGLAPPVRTAGGPGPPDERHVHYSRRPVTVEVDFPYDSHRNLLWGLTPGQAGAFALRRHARDRRARRCRACPHVSPARGGMKMCRTHGTIETCASRGAGPSREARLELRSA